MDTTNVACSRCNQPMVSRDCIEVHGLAYCRGCVSDALALLLDGPHAAAVAEALSMPRPVTAYDLDLRRPQKDTGPLGAW